MTLGPFSRYISKGNIYKIMNIRVFLAKYFSTLPCSKKWYFFQIELHKECSFLNVFNFAKRSEYQSTLSLQVGFINIERMNMFEKIEY